jgi:hypothetical protein
VTSNAAVIAQRNLRLRAAAATSSATDLKIARFKYGPVARSSTTRAVEKPALISSAAAGEMRVLIKPLVVAMAQALRRR